MKIIIAGSRGVTERDVRQAIECCSWANFATAVVSGTAKGADTFGENWARSEGIEIHPCPANWEQYGRKAGPLRNLEMAAYADGLIAVWDGHSRGTQSMIDAAEQHGLRMFVFRTDTGQCLKIPPQGGHADRWEAAEERAAMMEFGSDMTKKEAERSAGRLYCNDRQLPDDLLSQNAVSGS